jgi:uncharacterized membrane protein
MILQRRSSSKIAKPLQELSARWIDQSGRWLDQARSAGMNAMRLQPAPRRSFSPVTGLIAGAAVGSGLMYLLDPEKGTRRRALGRDKIVSAAMQSTRAGRGAAVDLSNRTRGWIHEIRSSFSSESVAPEVLVARIWAHVGNATSHPRAITITAEDNGEVRVEGHILSDEADDFIEAVSWVPGVMRVEDQLERHDNPEGVPSLQGGAVRRSSLQSRDRQYWTPGTRLLAGMTGGMIATWGASRRSRFGNIACGLGGALLLRSLSNMEFSSFFGLRGGRRVVDIHKTLEIVKPLDQVFAFWIDFQRMSKALEHVHSVEDLGAGRIRWKVCGPGNVPLTYDTTITRIVQNDFIAWKTEPGSPVAGAGVVKFQPIGNDRTRVDIRMSYNPPGGIPGHFIAMLSRTDPKSAMDDDLIRIKSLLETGKTRAHGERITGNGADSGMSD